MVAVVISHQATPSEPSDDIELRPCARAARGACLASFWRHVIACCLLLDIAVGSATAGEAKAIRIQFAPPDFEARYSLSVLDDKGKWVRTLCVEASSDEFEKTKDGLVWIWDGKDDRGKISAGNYSVRGYAIPTTGVKVGEVRWPFDDWAFLRATKMYEIADLCWGEESVLRVFGHVDGSTHGPLRLLTERLCTLDGVVTLSKGPLRWDGVGDRGDGRAWVDGDAVWVKEGEGAKQLKIEGLEKPADLALGVDGSIWVTDRGSTSPGVKRIDKEGRLAEWIPCSEKGLLPVRIAIEPRTGRLAILEAKEWKEVVRILEERAGDKPSWVEIVRKNRITTGGFEIEGDSPVPNRSEKGEYRELELPNFVRILLGENPEAVANNRLLDISVQHEGNFAALADGSGVRILHLAKLYPYRYGLVRKGDDAVATYVDGSAGVSEQVVTGLRKIVKIDCGRYRVEEE